MCCCFWAWLLLAFYFRSLLLHIALCLLFSNMVILHLLLQVVAPRLLFPCVTLHLLCYFTSLLPYLATLLFLLHVATPHPYSPLVPHSCSPLVVCYSTSLLPTPGLLFHILTPRLLFLLFLKGAFGAPLCLYSPRSLPACLLLFLAYVSLDGTPSPSFSFASSLWSYTNK